MWAWLVWFFSVIVVKFLILIIGALIVSSLLRVFTKNSFVWILVPRKYKKIAVFAASFVVYAILVLDIDILFVLAYSAISTYLSMYFYKRENKFKEFLKDVKK